MIPDVDCRAEQEESDIGNPGLNALGMWFRIGCGQLEVGTSPWTCGMPIQGRDEAKEAPLKYGVSGGRGNSGQRVQTSSYKVSKFWGCNVQHDDYS